MIGRQVCRTLPQVSTVEAESEDSTLDGDMWGTRVCRDPGDRALVFGPSPLSRAPLRARNVQLSASWTKDQRPWFRGSWAFCMAL